MKQATKYMVNLFPLLEKGFSSNTFQPSSELERVFLKLIRFVELNESFDLTELKQGLQGKDLEEVFYIIHLHFQQDTYLLPKDNSFIIKEENDLLNQTSLADFLLSKGLNFSRNKVNVYFSRGYLPEADLMIQGKPYWRVETIESYIKTKLQ